MNTNTLKKFAQETRRKLMQQVAAKLEFVTTNDTPELREKAEQVRKLKEEINAIGKEQVVDKVAYTWFNRFMALRFMDANDYQPIGIRVLSPLPGQTTPEILNQAKQGDIPAELKLKPQKILDLLDGRTPSSNPQNEAYKELLIASCNHLHAVLPFLFERINDYTELLLPDDLTSEFSIVYDVVQGMTEADCQEVEIIGWLYQFYISEWNDELISSKKKYDKNELAPASQLFTPKWIVQYMVDNTLGQLWSEMQPNTKVTSELEFYIKPAYKEQLKPRTKKSIEEITFFEPCTGSGHILSYAFDVYYKIYEVEGYNPAEIPELIITKNLFGVDIDQRAAQLASFVLIMKGRQKHRRFLRTVESKKITPNIHFYQDFEFDEKFKNATALGSLIRVESEDLKALKVEKNSLFGERQELVKNLYQLLGKRYDVVVTNPPYISSSRMEGSLKQYVEATYPETKSDLFATFILRCLELCNEDGLTGYMTPFVWMFISSYEKLREIIIDQHFINNLIQLEYSGFDGATVPICTFTLRNKNIPDAKGSYVRLSDFKGAQNQAPKTREAMQNPNCGWFYTAKQKDFEKIPGSPIGYWLSGEWLKVFEKKTIQSKAISDGQNITGNNDRYLRNFWEISNKEISINGKWPLMAKGGSFRRWSGNVHYVINWDAKAINEYKTNPAGRVQKESLWFRKGITWNLVTSGGTGFRLLKTNQLFNKAAPTLLFDKSDEKFVFCLLGFLNSKIITEILKLLNPSLNTNIKEVLTLPFSFNIHEDIDLIVKDCINISDLDWEKSESSDSFLVNELIRQKAPNLEESYDLYKQYWKNKFLKLHKNEEELNRRFIFMYNLQNDLSTDVTLEEITILKEETSIENGQLVFHADEVFKQFVSYAVGCMFGRYSLDKEGLILANQGETLEDYWRMVDGEMVDGEMVDGSDNFKNDRYGKGLQGFENLAAEHGAGDYGLSGDEENAEGRTVQSDGPNKESSGERTEQHSGGAIEGQQGVSSLSQDSTRFVSGAGNTTSNSRESSDAISGTHGKDYSGNNQSQKANSQSYGKNVTANNQQLSANNRFKPDEDNIIPILDEDWFEDDIVGRFNTFLKASFGAESFQKNAAFVEECLKKDLRKYFTKDFYTDHIKRYKKRPIYWMFSSPKGYFNVLVYMHRYTPDTLSNILNNYLREFIEKLKIRKEHLEQIKLSGSAAEQSKAIKEIDKLDKMLLDCQEYEREILYKMATERIAIDLDDGVLVNYNKFGKAIKEVKGLNDKKAKDKVKKFDWIDVTLIR